MDISVDVYRETAINYFKQGYNCAQSVVLTFYDLLSIDKQTLAMLASPFGAGMGRMREVCGAVAGMFMVLGLLEGYFNPKAWQQKKELYEKVQSLAEEFKEQCGSIICGELLNLKGRKADAPGPEKRSEEYYKKRPCAEITGTAAAILAKHLIDSKQRGLL